MKKIALGLIILPSLLLSSCQGVDKAIEDTFREEVERKVLEEDEKSKFQKIASVFIDQSNYPVSPIDILENAQDKAGFEFSTNMKSYIRAYLAENEIERYLTEEEIMDLLEKKKEEDFLLNPKLVRDLIDDLLQDLGWEDAEVEGGLIYVSSDLFSFNLIDPTNEEFVDTYVYIKSLGDWQIRPDKNPASRSNESISINKLPIENIDKVMETSLDLLKEMGDYSEYDMTSDMNYGVNGVYTNFYKGDLIFRTHVRGSRKDYQLIFDQDGVLIEKGES